jgi:phage terminase large subunit-like protein
VRTAYEVAADLFDPILTDVQERAGSWKPEPYQVPPKGNWTYWLFMGGRGTGKTDAGADWLDLHVAGPPCIPGYPGGHRPAIIAPTLGDAVDACVTGPTGLQSHNPAVRLIQRPGGTYATWPNGTEAKLFGAYTPEDVERLRAGGNRCCVWAEELAAWRQLEESWHHMRLGLRLGLHPRAIFTTTPKPRPRLKELLKDPNTAVTTARTEDNPHLPPDVLEELMRKYKGTRMGRQELDAELLEDVEGALWTTALIEKGRVKKHPDLVRVVVAVDPSGGDSAGNDEQGIIVAGRGVDGHGYILADRSCKLSPNGWGRRAVQAYVDYKADRIIGETNFGGDLVIANVETAAKEMDVRIATKKISASRGKAQRAEPVSALYGDPENVEESVPRVHHVGMFPELEDQQTTWTPDSGWSPDRMDAAVWAMTELIVKGPGLATVSRAGAHGRMIPGM